MCSTFIISCSHYVCFPDILLVSVNHLRPKFKPIVCYQISTPYSLTGRLTLYGLKKKLFRIKFGT